MQKPKLTFATLSIISLSIFLIVFGVPIAYYLLSGFLLAFNIKLDLLGIVNITRNLGWFGLIPQAIGVVLIGYFLLTRKLRVDKSKSKQQVQRLFVLALVIIFLVFMNFASVPVVKASFIDVTDYYLDTPLPIADFYVGVYSNDTYFAINGTNWDNFQLSTDASNIMNNVFGNCSGGEVIYVGAGDYSCGSRITLPSDVTVRGAGKYATRFNLENGVNDIFWTNEHVASGGTYDSHITLEDFTIDGNGANQVTGTHIRSNNVVCLYWDFVRDSVIRNVNFYDGRDYNCRLGFSSDYPVRNILVENCNFNTTTNEYGGNSDGWGYDVIYRNCIGEFSARDGFCHWGWNIYYYGCISRYNDYNGFYAESESTYNTGGGRFYYGCIAYNNTLTGFSSYYPRDIHYIGGQAYYNLRQGFWLRGQATQFIEISSMSIHDNSQEAANSYNGIEITTDVNYATITNNDIGNKDTTPYQRRGILLYGACTGALIQGNRIFNQTGDAIFLGITTGVSIIGNKFMSNSGWAIYISASANQTKIFNNDFTEENYIVYNYSGTDTSWGDNSGFITESWGTSVGTGTQQTIAHGLSGTPTRVVFSNINGEADAYQSASATSTNIYVTAASGVSYSWTAYYDPT